MMPTLPVRLAASASASGGKTPDSGRRVSLRASSSTMMEGAFDAMTMAEGA